MNRVVVIFFGNYCCIYFISFLFFFDFYNFVAIWIKRFKLKNFWEHFSIISSCRCKILRWERKYWKKGTNISTYTLRKKCPYSEVFWSAFSRIQTEYGEIQSFSPNSVQIRENAEQNNSEYGHFLGSERLNTKFLWSCNLH